MHFAWTCDISVKLLLSMQFGMISFFSQDRLLVIIMSQKIIIIIVAAATFQKFDQLKIRHV